jgi:hypothetical protein
LPPHFYDPAQQGAAGRFLVAGYSIRRNGIGQREDAFSASSDARVLKGAREVDIEETEK